MADAICSIAISPLGQELAVGTAKGEIYLAHLRSGSIYGWTLIAQLRRSAESLVFSAAGEIILAGDRTDENTEPCSSKAKTAQAVVALHSVSGSWSGLADIIKSAANELTFDHATSHRFGSGNTFLLTRWEGLRQKVPRVSVQMLDVEALRLGASANVEDGRRGEIRFDYPLTEAEGRTRATASSPVPQNATDAISQPVGAQSTCNEGRCSLVVPYILPDRLVITTLNGR
jgi:hypothetical protein